MKNIKNLNKPLFLIMIILFIFGLIMIFSASSIVSVIGYGKEPYYYFFKQLLFIIIGFIAFLVIINIPISFTKRFSEILLIAVLFFLGFLFVYGSLKNNSKSWFDLGFFSIQPSEFAKVIIILFLAKYYGKNIDKLNNIGDILKPLLVGFGIFALVFLQPDLGTGLIILGVMIGILFSLPMNPNLKKNLVILMLVGIIIVIAFYFLGGNKLLSERQKQRFDFMSPCSKYQESTGYQVCNGYIAINGGGIFGVGLGNSTQKFLYLPEAHTDFIFPIIVEETGVIGGIGVVILYMILLYIIITIARGTNSLTNSIIAYGVAIYIFLHIAINLVGALGIAPLTGVPLPFLSYGGSFALSLFIALGLVQRVAIESKVNNNVQRRV